MAAQLLALLAGVLLLAHPASASRPHAPNAASEAAPADQQAALAELQQLLGGSSAGAESLESLVQREAGWQRPWFCRGLECPRCVAPPRPFCAAADEALPPAGPPDEAVLPP